MSNSKSIALVLLLVLIAVLFVVGVSLGLTRSDAPGAGVGSEEDRRQMRSRWLSSAPITAKDLSGCARALGPFPVRGTCSLNIAPSDVRSRDLALRSADDVDARYEPKSGPPVPINVTLRDGKSVRFPIQSGGATISLTCGKALCLVEAIAPAD